MAVHPVTQYALDVVNGLRVVGESELRACQRHLDDLQRVGSDDFPYVFDEARADRIVRWFEHCRHVEGPLAGTTIELLPFQQFDLGNLFGWVDPESGYRRYQKAYIQEARKNAKTTILSGVALYLMVGDLEESPSVYCAAVDRQQARILYRSAMAMARKSLDIRKRLKIRDYEIAHITRGGQMVALSKDTKNKDGLNPSGAIIDEYHAHPTSEIYDLLWSAWGQRAQALMTIITTAGMDVESPCHKEYDYCKEILTGVVENERYFVMIRELDADDDEHDPANWIKANPLRAATPAGLEKLQEQHDEAFGSRNPAKIRTFRVKNLNRWVHGAEDSYMGAYLEDWDKLAISREEFLVLTKDLACNVGIDLSKKIDLTADGFVFALPDGRIAVTAHGFMPQAGLASHEKSDKTATYPEWAAAGWLTLTPGSVTDYAFIQSHIQDMELQNGWRVHELCFDPYNATHFANEMADQGYTTVEIRQGVQTLSEPTKLFRDLVATGKLVHDGSPLLRWCIGNAVTMQDNNENIRISKKQINDSRRVDLLAAVLDAVVRVQSLRESGTSVYDERGIRRL
jgi:phage terminase large subunit-like protein